MILSQSPQSKIQDAPATTNNTDTPPTITNTTDTPAMTNNTDTPAINNNTDTPDIPSKLNELFTLRTKQTKVLHHLTSTMQHNVIPQGFQIHITPQIMDCTADTQEEWEHTFLDTTKKLLVTTTCTLHPATSHTE